MKNVFEIANRYIIDLTRNAVLDKLKGEDTRVEQRLMTVLSLLANQPEELVSRDKLIKEVWTDYGGADEALTQAISFLRKLLNDVDKKIIETVPKKGYILHAIVTEVSSKKELQKKQNTGFKLNKKRTSLIAAFAVAITVLFVVLFSLNRKGPSSPDVLKSDKTLNSYNDTQNSTSPDIRPDAIKSKGMK